MERSSFEIRQEIRDLVDRVQDEVREETPGKAYHVRQRVAGQRLAEALAERSPAEQTTFAAFLASELVGVSRESFLETLRVGLAATMFQETRDRLRILGDPCAGAPYGTRWT